MPYTQLEIGDVNGEMWTEPELSTTEKEVSDWWRLLPPAMCPLEEAWPNCVSIKARSDSPIVHETKVKNCKGCAIANSNALNHWIIESLVQATFGATMFLGIGVWTLISHRFVTGWSTASWGDSMSNANAFRSLGEFLKLLIFGSCHSDFFTSRGLTCNQCIRLCSPMSPGSRFGNNWRARV